MTEKERDEEEARMRFHGEIHKLNRERRTRIILSCLLPDDPDVSALAHQLRIDPAQALGHLVALWIYWAEWEPTGQLKTWGENPDLMARAAHWRGRPQRFFDAMRRTGWITPEGTLARWDELWPMAASGREEWNRLRRSLRPRVLERDGAICRYCGSTEDALHIDHIRPLAKGGANILSNLQVLCGSCNSRKGARIDA